MYGILVPLIVKWMLISRGQNPGFKIHLIDEAYWFLVRQLDINCLGNVTMTDGINEYDKCILHSFSTGYLNILKEMYLVFWNRKKIAVSMNIHVIL